jgi:hypothetical protein
MTRRGSPSGAQPLDKNGTRQSFFTEQGDYRQRLRPLTKNQKSVLSLLGGGLLQAGIADLLHVSRSYVNQTVKRLESLDLIKRRKPTYFYDLSSEAKSLIAGTARLDEFTPARMHNFKRKYRIIGKTGDPSIDKRAHFSGSWKMRGPLRHHYWYPGEAGTPSVTVDYHIKTLVIYIDKGQQILARSVEEATELGWLAVQKARDAWIEDQRKFSAGFEVEAIGTVIGKPHAGFLMRQEDPVIKEVLDNGGKVGYSDYWVDKSPEEKLGPGACEAETAQPENMTRLGQGIQIIEQIGPTAFKELGKIGQVNDNVLQVQAMLQGSITGQQMLENVTKMISSVLLEMQQVRKENQELRDQFLGGRGGEVPRNTQTGQQRLGI